MSEAKQLPLFTDQEMRLASVFTHADTREVAAAIKNVQRKNKKGLNNGRVNKL